MPASGACSHHLLSRQLPENCCVHDQNELDQGELLCENMSCRLVAGQMPTCDQKEKKCNFDVFHRERNRMIR